MKKVLVEFYDEENLENVFSLLSMSYDKVMFITFSEDGTEEKYCSDSGLKKFIFNRLPDIETDIINVEEKTFLGIIKSLTGIINDQDAYDFDLTGGSEMVIAAIGHVVAVSSNPHISIHQYDIEEGKTIFRHPEFEIQEKEKRTPELTVPELVYLYGGKVTAKRDEMRPDAQAFKSEIVNLFDAVKLMSKDWNNFCTTPSEDFLVNGILRVKRFVENNTYMQACRKIGEALENAGLIADIEIYKEKGRFYYEYTLNCGKKLAFLYAKSGNVLEYYTYIAAIECGKYTDVCISVDMDADGIITTDNTDTSNEIDVMASMGHLPVCISCKNRSVINEYMYEISAVASAYCGKYAKPVIVSPVKNSRAIKNRAISMGIVLIENIANITFEKFKERLLTLENEEETETVE